jgi:hypothetical protein
MWHQPAYNPHNKNAYDEANLRAVIMPFNIPHDSHNSFLLPKQVIAKLDRYAGCLFDKPARRK